MRVDLLLCASEFSLFATRLAWGGLRGQRKRVTRLLLLPWRSSEGLLVAVVVLRFRTSRDTATRS